MSDLTSALPVVAIALSAGSLIYNWRRNASADTKAIWTALGTQSTDIALLKKQGDLFWGLIEQQMAKALIRPTHIELDRLLEKLVRNEVLTAEQEVRLIQMLREAVNDKEESAGVRAMAATILAIRLAKQEAARHQLCD